MDENDLEIARLVDRLLRRIHGSLHAKASDFDTHNVGQAGGLLLLTIAEAEPVRPQRLSAFMSRDKSQMTRMIGALERKGLVKRMGDPKDARVSLICTTAAGRDAVDKIRQAAAGVISGILTPLTAEEKTTLRHLLARI